MRDKRQSTMTMMPNHTILSNMSTQQRSRPTIKDSTDRGWWWIIIPLPLMTFGRRCRRYCFHDPPKRIERRCSKKKKPPTRGPRTRPIRPLRVRALPKIRGRRRLNAGTTDDDDDDAQHDQARLATAASIGARPQ
jgi:hypothetical protein